MQRQHHPTNWPADCQLVITLTNACSWTDSGVSRGLSRDNTPANNFPAIVPTLTRTYVIDIDIKQCGVCCIVLLISDPALTGTCLLSTVHQKPSQPHEWLCLRFCCTWKGETTQPGGSALPGWQSLLQMQSVTATHGSLYLRSRFYTAEQVLLSTLAWGQRHSFFLPTTPPRLFELNFFAFPGTCCRLATELTISKH